MHYISGVRPWWEPGCQVLNSLPGVVAGGCSWSVMLMFGKGIYLSCLSLLQVDSWALGVLLYTLVYGTMPFDGFDHKNLIRQISSGEYREPTQPSGMHPWTASGWAGRGQLTCPAFVSMSVRKTAAIPLLPRSLLS